MLMSMVASAQAEVRANSVSITPFVGFYDFESNEYDLDNSVTVGLRAGYNFTQNLGVEGFVHFVPTETQVHPVTGDDDVYLYGYGVEGLYHFFPTSVVVPFLAAGIGGIHYDVDGDGAEIDDMNKFAFDYGAGVKVFLPEKVANFFFADDLALRADIRHVIPMNDHYNDLMTTIGINFAFGGKEKCVDADKDGVCDNRDKCLDTPAGRIVDDQGCSAVTGKDGAAEEKGKVQAAPASAMVDTKVPVKSKVAVPLNVEFDTGKTIVKEKYYDDIKRVADFMKENPDSTASIEGHTDNEGSDANNKILSEKRAENVRQYLMEKFGIDGKRITATGFGSKVPVAGNDTAEGRQKNRRVEAILETTK